MRLGFLPSLFWKLVSIASMTVSGLVSLRLYNQFFDKETYGVIGVALQVLNYLPLLDGGFRMSVNRMILANPSELDRRRLLSFCQTIYFYLGILASIVATFLMAAYWMTQGQSHYSFLFFWILGMAAVLSVLTNAQAALLVGLRAQEQSFQVATVSCWANLGILWLCLHKGAGIWSFPMSTVGAVVVSYPIALVLIRRLEPEIRFLQFRINEEFWLTFANLKADAWACLRSQVSIVLLFSVDAIIVKFLCGDAIVGVYLILMRLFTVIRSFLQAVSEVAWPLIARQEEGTGTFTMQLLRLNSWIYGGTMGAVAPLLLPFVGWYMDPKWVADRTVFYLLIARFLITGVSSPAAYALLGLGKFQAVARCIEHELVAACVLSIVFGLIWFQAGIVFGFVAATVFGTLIPIFTAYVAATNQRLAPVLWRAWWRAALGMVVSFLAAWAMKPANGHGIQLVYTGIIAVSATIVLAAAVAYLRLKFSATQGLLRVTVLDLMKRV